MGMCYFKQESPLGFCVVVANVYSLRYDTVADMLIAMTTDDDAVAVVVSDITPQEAELLTDEYFNLGKLDLRGYGVDVMNMDELTDILNDAWREAIKEEYGEDLYHSIQI